MARQPKPAASKIEEVEEYKNKFEEYKKKIEEAVDKYGGKWIKAGIFIKEHGEKAYNAGKAVFDGCKEAIQLCQDKKWDEAQGKVDPLKASFEECKTEAENCFKKLQEVANDLPGPVKSMLDASLTIRNPFSIRRIPSTLLSLATTIRLPTRPL